MKRPGFLSVFLVVLVIGLSVRVAHFGSVVINYAQAEDKKLDAPKKEEPSKTKSEAESKKEPVKEPAKEPERAPVEEELSDADLNVLKQLSQRRRDLDAQARKIDQREAMLKAAQASLEKKYAELDQLRTEIKELLGVQAKEDEARIVSLVKVYENMKPSEAAEIFNTLDLKILLQVMGRMSERKMSPILAAMNADRAREVTTNLATEKKLPEAAAESMNPSPTTNASMMAQEKP